ncbi:MAG: hypothetical protein VX512_04440 [Pseudomonadota bacterium]|nr:hypothetical protein [Pseudomonadota bacterium]MEE2794066.1 hypothetical protein [Pseudomonadota bacterium]NCP25270.1 hypothetical protein [Erythrobacter sp.]
MRTNIVTLGLAATALVAAPLAAQAADRSAAPISDESELAGGASRILILAVVAAAIFAGIEISDNDDPVSP